MIKVLAAVRGTAPERIEDEVSGYGDLKRAVADTVVEHLALTRERYAEIRPDVGALEGALAAGAGKARRIASQTLA